MWDLGFRVPGSKTNIETVREALFKGSMRSSAKESRRVGYFRGLRLSGL